MPIKDKEKAREYFKKYMADRRKGGLTVKPENVLNPNLVKPTPEMLNPVKPIGDSFVKPVKPLEAVKPIMENVKPCPHCPQTEKQIKELELKIISLQETNRILRKDLDYWQEPLNPSPYEKAWKEKYLELEKKTDEKLKEQTETINRLKEKLREKTNENQVMEQKYNELKNPSQNNDNSPTKPILVGDNIIPCLFDKKHKKTIFYSCPDPCFQGKSCSNCGLLLVRP